MFQISRNVQFANSIKGERSRTEPSIKGGFLSNGRYCWHAKGSHLEIRECKQKWRVGFHTFRNVKDSNIEVIWVEELHKSDQDLGLLIVGFNCSVTGGTVCLFNVFTSKIVHEIKINNKKLSSLHVLDPGTEVSKLAGPLRDFDGVVAVGTDGGEVFLIDLCKQICERNSKILKEEYLPSKLLVLPPDKLHRIKQYREVAICEENHLAIILNSVSDNKLGYFTLKGQKGDDRIYVSSEEVTASSLYYCPQLTSLLVGYNFGAFQIWNLNNFQLDFTSSVCDEHIPITHFAFQEATDDPMADCYLWVSYSNTQMYLSGLPIAVMYSLSYESKHSNEIYGNSYERFRKCGIRFQVELDLTDDNEQSSIKGGLCMGMQPITKICNNLQTFKGDSMALCLICWKVWLASNEIKNFAMLFDINQWYHDQMPCFTNWSNASSYCLTLKLNSITPNFDAFHCLKSELDIPSLRLFAAIQREQEHFYPSSLSFDLSILTADETIVVHVRGLQEQLLQHIKSTGPICLLKPNEIYQKILNLKLLPIFADFNCNTENEYFRREIILSVITEQGCSKFLHHCAEEWANGRFSAMDCSLDFLLKWAKQRINTLKLNCDNLCAPLFDYSRASLDQNSSLLLSNSINQINIIYELYKYVLETFAEYVPCIETSNTEKNDLEMITVYFEVLQWMLNIGLLPECHSSTYDALNDSDKIHAPYPAEELVEYYGKRRAELQMISKDKVTSSDSLLFIDNLINNKFEVEVLQQQWQADGGSGLYPPPSLQSLLRTYLIPNTTVQDKHLLVLYLFLDLAKILDRDLYSPIVTCLIKFPTVFGVSSSMIKITQGFWQLDHGDYAIALDFLLDTMIEENDLKPWHHAIAMKSLLLQNQEKSALFYMQVKNPPIINDNDVLTVITLYISNSMLTEAFNFLKVNNYEKDEKFLMHFFNECNKNESLQSVLYRTLNGKEERALLNYLNTSSNPSTKELQVFYYLLRSKYMEGFDAYSILRTGRPECQGLIGQRNATKTDLIVNVYRNLLPDVNKKFIEFVQRERHNVWKTAEISTPLSGFLLNEKEKIKFKSNLLCAAISKAKDIGQDKQNDLKSEEIPFLKPISALKRPLSPEISIVYPTMIERDENGKILPCAKKIKLSPKAKNLRDISIKSNLLTPIIKRDAMQRNKQTPSFNSHAPATPHSILKKTGLTPVSRQSFHRSVQFDAINDSLSSKDETGESKSTSEYFSTEVSNEGQPSVQCETHDEGIKSTDPEDNVDLNNTSTSYHPKGRKSYKRKSIDISPIRMSPRLSKRILEANISKRIEFDADTATKSNSGILEDTHELSEIEKPEKSSYFRIKSRESISKNLEKEQADDFSVVSSNFENRILGNKNVLNEKEHLDNDFQSSLSSQIDSKESTYRKHDTDTEPLTKSPFKLKGRRSLNRKVLINNALKMLVSEEINYSKKTKETINSTDEEIVKTPITVVSEETNYSEITKETRTSNSSNKETVEHKSNIFQQSISNISTPQRKNQRFSSSSFTTTTINQSDLSSLSETDISKNNDSSFEELLRIYNNFKKQKNERKDEVVGTEEVDVEESNVNDDEMQDLNNESAPDKHLKMEIKNKSDALEHQENASGEELHSDAVLENKVNQTAHLGNEGNVLENEILGNESNLSEDELYSAEDLENKGNEKNVSDRELFEEVVNTVEIGTEVYEDLSSGTRSEESNSIKEDDLNCLEYSPDKEVIVISSDEQQSPNSSSEYENFDMENVEEEKSSCEASGSTSEQNENSVSEDSDTETRQVFENESNESFNENVSMLHPEPVATTLETIAEEYSNQSGNFEPKKEYLGENNKPVLGPESTETPLNTVAEEHYNQSDNIESKQEYFEEENELVLDSEPIAAPLETMAEERSNQSDNIESKQEYFEEENELVLDSEPIAAPFEIMAEERFNQSDNVEPKQEYFEKKNEPVLDSEPIPAPLEIRAEEHSNQSDNFEPKEDSFVKSVKKTAKKRTYTSKFRSKKLFKDNENPSLTDAANPEPFVETLNKFEIRTYESKKPSIPYDKNISSSGTTREDEKQFETDVATIVHSCTTNIEPVKSSNPTQEDKNVEEAQEVKIDLDVKPKRKVKKARSVTPTKHKETRSATHIDVIENQTIDCVPSTSKEIVEEKSTLKLLRRLRSSSVDHTKTYSQKDTSNSSVKKRKTRANSVCTLPSITENDAFVKVDVETSEDYSTSRRLTRLQSSIIKTSKFDPTSLNVEIKERKIVKAIRRSKTPEKTETNSPASSMEEQKVFKRTVRSRSNSNASESASQSSTNKKLTPEKQIDEEISVSLPRKRTRSNSNTTVTSTQSPKKETPEPSIGMRTRARTQSESSVTSSASEMSVTNKKNRRKANVDDEVESNTSLSSRHSKRSNASQSENTVATRRTTRKNASVLEKVVEEPVENVKSSKSKKNFKKK